VHPVETRLDSAAGDAKPARCLEDPDSRLCREQLDEVPVELVNHIDHRRYNLYNRTTA
jgi:hypothetical protein